jgi:hypothetical protein
VHQKEIEVTIMLVRLELNEIQNCVIERDIIQAKEEKLKNLHKQIDNMPVAIESSGPCSVEYMRENTESRVEVERREPK